MRQKFAALIEVRKLIALSFAALFIYMVIAQIVEPNISIALITLVIGYYFGKSTALDKPRD